MSLLNNNRLKISIIWNLLFKALFFSEEVWITGRPSLDLDLYNLFVLRFNLFIGMLP